MKTRTIHYSHTNPDGTEREGSYTDSLCEKHNQWHLERFECLWCLVGAGDEYSIKYLNDCAGRAQRRMSYY